MTAERPSRFEATRRKLRVARYAVVAGSAAAFGGFALAARAGHAGKATTGSAAQSSQVTRSSDDSHDGSSFGDDQSQSFGYGSSTISPSTSNAPLVQSGGS
jgi:hypothetical protein